MLSAALVAWATTADPVSDSWFTYARDSFAILLLVTVVLASFFGWITWPPERRRMQKMIDDLTAAVQESSRANQLAAPTVSRVTELVEQRVLVPSETKRPDPSLAEVMAKLAELQAGLGKVTGDDDGG